MDKLIQKQIKEINKLDLSLEEKNKKIQALYIQNYNIDTETNEKIECTHYNNNCNLYCNICMDYFSCRLCHDNNVSSHNFNRYSVNKIQCKKCKLEQDVSNECINCKIKFGVYYCNICHLYENENIEIYHCEKCNICRKGKKELFKHCDKCNGCINISIVNNHKCINKSVESNCPICMESIFYSVKQITSMKCGHYIHLECLQDYSKSNYKCPLCLVSLCDMTEQWEKIDNYLLLNLIPDEYKKKVNIVCYDCKKHSESDFHFDYIKCLQCNSYNTTIKQ
tara:strand:- start:81 stop:920 length:840 start_codon:yes stop_codon:yes gene_type:complete